MDPSEVEHFLNEFKTKMNLWGLILRTDRTNPINRQTLANLQLSEKDCKEILNQLQVTEYCEGPVPDTLYRDVPMWIFGKMVKGVEIYIKITIGQFGSKVVCISFHQPAYKMTYPFKK